MIEKLEFEMKKARDDSEKSTEARIGRLKAKHETEIGNHIFFVLLNNKIFLAIIEILAFLQIHYLLSPLIMDQSMSYDIF